MKAWKSSNGYIRTGDDQYQHRLVIQAAIGRPLLRTEHVHHINGDKTDNRLENLRIVTSAEHALLHSCVTDTEIRQLLLLGHSGKAIAGRRISTQRINRIKKAMVAEGFAPTLVRAALVFGSAHQPFRDAVVKCIRGHEFSDANTIRRPNGSRQCRACLNAHKRDTRARRKAA